MNELYSLPPFQIQKQSNPVNTDTEGTMDSVRINGVSILSGVCKLSQTYTFHWSKISKDIKQIINITQADRL